ncbi:MAG: tRNA preQ1(34) S-adenosylmethionine ribosyltransferase-isomerase QueA [Candidatus Hydrogenedentes bacterium]|nr:tRNA preQ1(34) S-adenosylmethionine ribosyltransferase-isomerase QueA [Candidatus Hydrogenedentota bacterium]
MNTSELDYELPEGLIAQRPCDDRESARMLVLDRADGSLRLDTFRNVAAYLHAGDCMVLNDTRVIQARLYGRKPTGGHVEVFLLRERAPGTWDALVRPSARVKPGTAVRISERVEAVVGPALPGGRRQVTFNRSDVLGVLEEEGEVPLPPYVRREHADEADRARYQTVYARAPGAVAAPTAGLHFTESVFASLDAAGVRRAHLTLHVGYGTFRPIQTDRVEDHELEAEDYEFPAAAADLLNETRAAGGRVVAVGTTSTRVLETQFEDGAFRPGAGRTGRFIYPPYRFEAVDALQTNFHLPRSSLLALVCAFAGVEAIREAYRLAIRERFRFYSYGDVMLIV